jgi:hypothetical protein
MKRDNPFHPYKGWTDNRLIYIVYVSNFEPMSKFEVFRTTPKPVTVMEK